MNNKKNAEKFLEKNGIPEAGPNYKDRLIETMVEYANNITISTDDKVDYGFVNDVLPRRNILTFEFFRETFKGIVVDSLGVEPNRVTDDANLRDDLGCDSLDSVEIIWETEKRLNFLIYNDDISDIQVYSFKDVVARLYEIYKR